MSPVLTHPGARYRTAQELVGCLHAMHAASPIAVTEKRDFLNMYCDADFVAVTMAGQVYEYEVKISRSDFLKDASKRRHKIYTGLQEGLRPNRFWYVAPTGLLATEDIPAFAGWIECVDGKLEQRIRAPLLHRECHGVTILLRLARAMRERRRMP
jgi:hypothetical protein